MIPGKHPHHPTFIRSFLFAHQGYRLAFHQERNIKVMIAGGVVGALIGASVGFDGIAWIVYALVCACVIAFELMNTALEKVVDLVSPEFHPLAGQAKDIAAAAVWSICLIAFGIGILLVARALGFF